MTHRVALVWFRRDLRLTDNPALSFALKNADRIVPAFIHDPEEQGHWPPGAASNWWLHYSLTALGAALRERECRLIIRRGPALGALRDLIRETGASLVTWNRLYEPAVVARDTAVKAALSEAGIQAESHNAGLLFEPWTIRNAEGKPYRVFTPFWRTAAGHMDRLTTPTASPKRIAAVRPSPVSLAVEQLDLRPTIAWDSGLSERWQPGEAGALKQLQRFAGSAGDYSNGRDRPDLPGTSSLSPHLHFGEIGPRQVVAHLHLHSPRSQSHATYLRELGWREFAHHLLFHFPQTTDKPFDPRFASWPWKRSRSLLRAWQRGMTGYPIVDAGMRELWHTGWMHNRVRMIVASFLTKNLQIHWLEGARWFWDTLVDADLANNTLGWQWTAGCGADAAPYYRIFNPVLQAEKFDPERQYLRTWVPEVSALPDKWIHRPWAAPEQVLAAAHVTLGKSYPRPIVDLQRSRDEALEAYKRFKEDAD